MSAPHVNVQMVEAELNKGNFGAISKIEEPHLAATLFKQWIRELSQPLIPEEFYSRCYECGDSIEESIEIFDEFPELNKKVLRFIIRYLRQQILLPNVVETTKMDEDNIALIFAPSVFR